MIKKLLIPAVLAIAVIAGAFGASGAFAQNPPGNPATHENALFSKVATILGIDQQKLTSAFKQASKELGNEQIDKAVADGRITQEYANWLKQRPDSAVGGPGFGGPGFERGMHGFMGSRDRGAAKPTPAPSASPSR